MSSEQKSGSHWRFYLFIAFLVALVVLGAYAWSIQLGNGLIVTDMRDVVSWGLYISLFAWFVGISAGGLIVSSAAAVFGIRQWQPISKVANLLALVAIALAAFAILPDLGQPGRVIYIFTNPNLSSPLVWDVTIIFTYLAISFVELVLMITADRARARGKESTYVSRERLVRGIAFVALPVAVLTHSITAWIFGLQISRPLWNTALLAPIFLASALVSGLALVIFVTALSNRFGALKVDTEVLTGLAKLLGVIILVDLFLLGSEYITAVWPATPAEISPLTTQFFGPYWWLAWTQIVLAFVALALVAVPRTRGFAPTQVLAAIFALVEVFFYRLELVIPAFVNPLVQYPPGTSIGTTTGGTVLSGFGVSVSPVDPSNPGLSFVLSGTYFPTWIEWSIAVGIVAVAALLITLGIRYLPVREGAEGSAAGSTIQWSGSRAKRDPGETASA